VRFTWLDLPRGDPPRATGRAAARRRHAPGTRLRRWLGEVARSCPGRHALLVVGDSVLDSKPRTPDDIARAAAARPRARRRARVAGPRRARRAPARIFTGRTRRELLLLRGRRATIRDMAVEDDDPAGSVPGAIRRTSCRGSWRR
jgi:hypothetical protein